MPVIANEPKKYSDVFAFSVSELESAGYSTDVVTVNQAAAEFTYGTLLGQVTVGGKYKIWDSALTDGAETVAAIVAEAITIPATTDTQVLVMKRGPMTVKDAGLELNGETLADAKAGLEALNPPIVVANAI